MPNRPAIIRRRSASPWQRLEEMSQEMDRWMQGGAPRGNSPEGLGWAPRVDFADTEDEFLLTAELPGIAAEDVSVDVEEGILTLKGQKKDEREEKTKNLHIYEREYGSFERRFTLPRSVNPDQVKADFANGVLTVHLPKRKEATGRTIQIESKKK